MAGNSIAVVPKYTLKGIPVKIKHTTLIIQVLYRVLMHRGGGVLMGGQTLWNFGNPALKLRLRERGRVTK